jgi:hypothetical protein
LASCGGAILAGATSARAVSVNFSAASDLSNNFSINFDGTPSTANFNWSSSAGVSDGSGNFGGVTTTNTDATAVYVGANRPASETAFKLTDGASVSVEFMCQSLGTDRNVQIGFLNRFNSSFNNDGTNANVNAAQKAESHATGYVSVRTYATGQIEQQVKSGNSNSTPNTTLRAADPINPLIDGEWYKLTLSAVETAPNTFSLLTTLDDYGSGGGNFVTNIYTQTTPSVVTVTGFDDASLDQLGIGNGVAGVRQIADNPQIDNFVVNGTAVQATLPEPASLGLLAVGGAGLLARRRARHRPV